MTTLRATAAPKIATTTPATPQTPALPAAARYVFAGVRIALGWVFLWAFLDKLFGLGHETPSARAHVDPRWLAPRPAS